MGLYEFKCTDCKKSYEELATFDPSGQYAKVCCPDCGSKSKKKSPSCPSIGHTSSKMDNFEYRAGFNMEKAKAERRMAEAASNGKSPYNEIDDISSGKYFGEVK